MAKIRIVGYSSDDVAEDLAPSNTKRKTGNCCYCEISLDKDNFSWEHVIPKHKGGKIILPCCKPCNFEKGGMMLSSYIKILTKSLNKLKRGKYIHSEYTKLARKIANATKIQETIKNKQI